MSVQMAIEKLNVSNRELNIILNNIHEQLADVRLDPRMEGITDDLEALFESYLATWVKTNTQIIDILEKGN